MSRKLIISTYFLVLSFLFLPGKTAAKTYPIYIYLDLDFRLEKELKYPLEYLKKDVLTGMEKGFSDEGILVVKKSYPIDYKLEGTIEVKRFIPGSVSYSIIFEAKHFKISAARYQGLIPPLIFDPFTNRDRTGGVKPAQDLDDAIDLSLEDFLWVMNKNKVFAFQDHSLFAKGVKITRKDIREIKKREDFDRMADKIIEELKKFIDAALKIKPSQSPVIITDNTPILKQILKEIMESREQQKASIDSLKKMLEKQMDLINEIIYVNIASIIIKTNAVKEKLPFTFTAVIMPITTCKDCKQGKIEAQSLGRISNQADYDKFLQENQYRIPYPMTGQIVKEEEQWVIRVTTEDFKTIFDIDSNSREKHMILNSVYEEENLYPRILIDFR